jgi:GAF domain-containing protein
MADQSPDTSDLLVDYLVDVAARTADRVGRVAGVAITLPGTEPVTVGASSELARRVDEMQYAVGSGPCLHALATGEGLYVADLGGDRRWGDYGPHAAAMGAASCLSTPVMVGGSAAAVLKVYSSEVDGLDETQQQAGRLMAVEMSGGMALARRLRDQDAELGDRVAAMNSRRAIDLALGMIMARQSCGPDAAFDVLRGYSQQRNVKVRDVAEAMVARVSAESTDRAPFRAR